MSFHPATASKAPIDLHLPETFHRQKRTVLLFSSALIILGLFGGTGTSTFSAPMVGGLSMPTDTVRLLLWLGAAYYLVGFYLEVQVARLINSDAMRGAGMDTVDNSMGKLGAQLEDFAHRLTELDATVTKRSSFTKPPILDQGETMKALNQMMAPHGPTGPSTSGAMHNISRLEQRISEQNTLLASQQRMADEVCSAIKSYSVTAEELRTLLSSTHRDLSRISRTITGERRFSFWVWEIGGVGGAFLLATLLNIPWITRLGAAAWKVIAPLNTTPSI